MLVTHFRIKYALYKIVLAWSQLLDTDRLHPLRERSLRALNRSVDYLETHMAEAMGFETQKELISYALDETRVPGYYLEFGVFTGGTLRFMARRRPSMQFHGFDSFEGLPEDWRGGLLTKQTFFMGGRTPNVPGNVLLHKGWFRDSVPQWRAQYPGKVAFIHIDCDLYSSTVDILDGLEDSLQVGTVILFDEYFNYPNWENHEFKAWKEFVARKRIRYEYIGFARQQVAVRILNIG